MIVASPIVTSRQADAYTFSTEAEADRIADSLCFVVRNRGTVEVCQTSNGLWFVVWSAPTNRLFYVSRPI